MDYFINRFNFFPFKRLFTTRLRAIVDKYNLIMKNIQKEDKALFDAKLNKIDEVKFFKFQRLTNFI